MRGFVGALLVLVVLLPLPAPAAEPLEELFGVTLGAPCAVCQKQQPEGELPEPVDGMRVYQITPPEPLAVFETYQVRVVALKGGKDTDGKVVDVSAVGLPADEDTARKAFAALREAYTRRFGAPELREHHRSTRCVFRPKGSQRRLTLLLRDDLLAGHWILYINAMDLKAFARASKAAAE